MNQMTAILPLVENKDMIPQRDYTDFTKYVNENNTGTK